YRAGDIMVPRPVRDPAPARGLTGSTAKEGSDSCGVARPDSAARAVPAVHRALQRGPLLGKSRSAGAAVAGQPQRLLPGADHLRERLRPRAARQPEGRAPAAPESATKAAALQPLLPRH